MLFDDLLDACRRNDSERFESLVTVDPTLLICSTPDSMSLGAGQRVDLLLSRGDDHRPITRNTVDTTLLDTAINAPRCLRPIHPLIARLSSIDDGEAA